MIFSSRNRYTSEGKPWNDKRNDCEIIWNDKKKHKIGRGIALLIENGIQHGLINKDNFNNGVETLRTEIDYRRG